MADRLNIRSVDVDASTTDNNSTPPKAEVELPDVHAEVVDRFDPKRLRLSQDFAAQLGVRKKLITVPVKKPPKEWWVQVHPDDDYHIETAVLELKEEREVYLVDPSLWEELSTESTFSPRAIYTAINRQGVPFLWPIRMPGPDGKLDEWNRSAFVAAETARGRWVRVQANMSLGAYEVWEASAKLPDPQWPEQAFPDLLRTAFKDRYIDDLQHPVLTRLRGET